MAEEIKVETLGGLAGFGGRIRRTGSIDLDLLSSPVRTSVEKLFETGSVSPEPLAADALRYRLARETPQGTEVIEVNEGDIPAQLTSDLQVTVGPPDWQDGQD